MKNPVVVAVNSLKRLSPVEYRLVLSLTRELAAAAPSPKLRKKPGPKPGTKRKAKAVEADTTDKKFPKEKRIAPAASATA